MTAPVHVLLVEDNEADVLLVEEALADFTPPVALHVVHDGEEALAFLHRQGPFQGRPRPHFVLLDGNTPKCDAIDVLRAVRQHPSLGCLPVVVYSGSADQADVQRSYRAGANAYFVKPIGLDDFVSAIERTLRFWATTAATPVTEDGPPQ